jgi:hypothetical protein
MAEALATDRVATARHGRKLEYFTIAWNCLEGLVAVIAGLVAGSISLLGSGIDSFIEVTSGAALLWRMSVDADVHRTRTERTARLEDCWRVLRVLGSSQWRQGVHDNPHLQNKSEVSYGHMAWR